MSEENDQPAADPQWMTKSEALAALQKSDRSLDRLVNARKIQRKTRPREGRPPEPLYFRADIQRLTAVEAFPLPGPEDKQVAPSRPVYQPESLGALAQLFAAALHAQPSAPAIPPVAPVAQWLPIKAASSYTGLSARLIRTLIDGGILPAVRDGRVWKVRRQDLDELRVPPEFRKEDARATSASGERMTRTRRNGHGL